MESIILKTSSAERKIYIGEEVIEFRLPALINGQKNFVVTDSNVYALYEAWFKRYFSSTEIFVLPAGEKNKNFRSLYEILEKMAGAGMHRSSRLFVVGGGVVGDIGGLAAALYMRGISYVQIPTTLLAQVDSSIGGKTAADLGGVKNVVGTFYQPEEVLIDPAFLSTLPQREIKCGLGEIVKYAALDQEIFNELTNGQGHWMDVAFLERLICACVRYKARIVEADEKECGRRRCLNVGHTTGHAIELTCGLSHGECVLYGMLYEMQMAMELQVCEPVYGENLIGLIKTALAVSPNEGLRVYDVRACAEKARSDKKNIDDDKVTMSIGKTWGEWETLSLPFEEYAERLARFIKGE